MVKLARSTEAPIFLRANNYRQNQCRHRSIDPIHTQIRAHRLLLLAVDSAEGNNSSYDQDEDSSHFRALESIEAPTNHNSVSCFVPHDRARRLGSHPHTDRVVPIAYYEEKIPVNHDG